MMRVRCHKHKSNYAQFICLYEECELHKLGCIQCFPDHDGHTRQNMDIQSFFEKVTSKDKELELKYLQLTNQNNTKKIKEQLIRSIQQQCKIIQSKTFNFIDRHCEAVINTIQNKNLNDSSSQLRVKAYHDDLERIKNKSAQSLENKEMEFLLNFVLTNDYNELISTANQMKDKILQEFTYDMNQIINTIDNQFSDLFNQLDTQFSNLQPSLDQRNQTIQNKYNFTLGNLPKSPIRNNNHKVVSKSPIRYTSTNQSRLKTPDSNNREIGIGSSKKIYISRFLMSSVSKENEENQIKDRNQDSLIINVLNNYLNYEYLNDNLTFLKQYYQEFSEFTQISQKEKDSLINEDGIKILQILWENLMIEWLKTIFNQNYIQVQVTEIEENYQSFLELFDKKLKLHEFVVCIVKQKIRKPKIDYQTWIILANKSTNSYKMYNIKPNGKKVSKELTNEDQSFASIDQIKHANVYAQFPKIFSEHFDGDFIISRDLKVIIKGILDPSFQSYLLAERLQVFLNLVTNPQVAINLNFQQIEKHFDQVLVNFKHFVYYLNLSLKDLNIRF